METVEYQNVVSIHEINKFPISITTTEVNVTGSWRFAKPLIVQKVSPCSAGCPAHTNIPRYIFHLLKNELDKAAEILREENPFPATCGRVCPHFCQNLCNRNEYDGTVQIREIEKFVGDYSLKIPFRKPEKLKNRKVAIVGGGPAGLSCAYFLAKEGYSVSIYEREKFLGGLMVYGIPDFRLPKNIVEKEINNILSLGNINVNLGVEVTSEKLSELANNFDAVFIGVGLDKDKLPPGIDIDNNNILSGYKLLKKINTDKEFREKFKGYRIGVIGGGNVAFDVARSSLRLSNNVEIIYRRTLQEAPSFEEEKNEGIEEGINLREKTIITEVERGKTLKLKLASVKKITEEGMEYKETGEIIEVDKLVIATGQEASFIIRNKEENIFTGGDYACGASTVIEAIASGKENAFKIMNFLKDRAPDPEKDGFIRYKKDYDRYEIVNFDRINLFYFKKEEPIKIKKITPEERKANFSEISIKPLLEEILKEANRCFSCGVCNLCKTCWFFCPDVCISIKNEVEIDYDYCKGCGLCSSECPRGVIDMVEDK